MVGVRGAGPLDRVPTVGYYVHHQGLGHLHRARSIGAHLAAPMTVLSSLPSPDPDLSWVHLPADDRTRPPDHTAHGTLHWVPRHDQGLRRRMALVAEWIDRADPDLMVVDVSVEIAVMSRLMGVPTVVMAMPGDRSDRAHRSAYDSAHAILAPWAAEFSTDQWSDPWPDKTFHAGAISRYAGRTPPPRSAHSGPPRVLVLWGRGGRPLPDGFLDAAARATPGWTWRQAGTGPDTQVPVWDLLAWSDVVVTHGGLGGRREDRFGQPVRLDESGWRRHAVDGAPVAVLLPGRAGHEAADDALDREHLGAATQHDPTGQVITADLGGEVGHVGRDQVVADDVVDLGEPVGRHGGEHPTLVGHGLGHDHVEGAEPIRGDHQESVLADGVEVTDLAAVDVRERKRAHRTGAPS